MQFDDHFDDSQSQALALASDNATRNLVETLEDALMKFGGDAIASVADAEQQHARLLGIDLREGVRHNVGLDGDTPSGRCETQGVTEQVTQNLLQTHLVGIELWYLLDPLDANRQLLIAGGHFHLFNRFFHNLLQADDLAVQTPLTGVGTRDQQQVFDQSVQSFAAGTGASHKLTHLLADLACNAGQHEIEITVDSVERGTQFVRYHRDKVGLHARGLSDGRHIARYH